MPPNNDERLKFSGFSVEAEFERPEDVVNSRADLLERVFNPKPLNRASFPESYIKGDTQLNVCFGLAFSSGVGLVTRYYRAVFQHRPLGEEPERLKDHVGRKVLDSDPRTNPQDADEMQFSVLVPVGKFGKSGEWVITGNLRSLVRLNPLDDCHIVRGHALDVVRPHAERVFPLLGAGVEGGVEGVFCEDGELRSARDLGVGGVVPGSFDKQPDQVVEDRAGVV